MLLRQKAAQERQKALELAQSVERLKEAADKKSGDSLKEKTKV